MLDKLPKIFAVTAAAMLSLSAIPQTAHAGSSVCSSGLYKEDCSAGGKFENEFFHVKESEGSDRMEAERASAVKAASEPEVKEHVKEVKEHVKKKKKKKKSAKRRNNTRKINPGLIDSGSINININNVAD
ncbi:hypothetical protein N9L47_07975 [Rhodobacteraceae bacterium]|nr:hypothetical protein [Paracoccaceae bacterium]